MAHAQLGGGDAPAFEDLAHGAQALVQLAVIRVHQVQQSVASGGPQFHFRVAQQMTEALVAEQQLAGTGRKDVDGVGKRAQHLRPVALALGQRQFRAAALGHVADAQRDGIQRRAAGGQAHQHPQVAFDALAVDQVGVQIQIGAALEQGIDEAEAVAGALDRVGADQHLPGLFQVLDPQ